MPLPNIHQGLRLYTLSSASSSTLPSTTNSSPANSITRINLQMKVDKAKRHMILLNVSEIVTNCSDEMQLRENSRAEDKMDEGHDSDPNIEQASDYRGSGRTPEPDSFAVCADGGLSTEPTADRVERMPQEVSNTWAIFAGRPPRHTCCPLGHQKVVICTSDGMDYREWRELGSAAPSKDRLLTNFHGGEDGIRRGPCCQQVLAEAYGGSDPGSQLAGHQPIHPSDPVAVGHIAFE